MTFADLYGTDMDTELGTEDRTSRFTTVLRKRYVNEGQRWFNEQTGCYVKRAELAMVDGTAEYDLESTGVIAAGDYIRPSKTTASLRRYDGAGTDPSDYSYVEGPELPFKAEETLNQTRPNWRSESPGTPQCWTLLEADTAVYFTLVPPPDVPAAETWVVLWPYVAQPADMTDDAHEPYGNATPRTTLRPYHRALLHYGAAQLEKRRKNHEGVDRQMKLATIDVAKYKADQTRPNGQAIRLAHNYRGRLRSRGAVNPFREP
jgi:hypothetical protein